jgi:ribosomal protein L37AE/L43A
MANSPVLHVVKGKQNMWNCSACGAEFSGSKMAVVNSFGAHVRLEHKAPAKADVDEVAAKILREVGEKP